MWRRDWSTEDDVKLQLRPKLVVSFLAVIATTGAVGTTAGVYLISSGIVREAQNKVTLDLNSARQVYQNRLEDIQCALEFTALRRFAVREALRTGNRALLLESLRESMERGGLDILTVTDPEGRVVLRARNPGVAGDSPIPAKSSRPRRAARPKALHASVASVM